MAVALTHTLRTQSKAKGADMKQVKLEFIDIGKQHTWYREEQFKNLFKELNWTPVPTNLEPFQQYAVDRLIDSFFKLYIQRVAIKTLAFPDKPILLGLECKIIDGFIERLYLLDTGLVPVTIAVETIKTDRRRSKLKKQSWAQWSEQ